MPTTPKSRRSGGPQTAEGKLASSRNSLKTGVYSKQEVLPGEDPKELLELEQYFMEDFAPQGVTESALVHDLTVLAWKKLRLERLEYRRLRDKLNEPLDYFEHEKLGFSIPEEAHSYFDDPSLISELDLSLALEHLKNSKKIKTAKYSLASLEEVQANSLTTFVKIKRKIEDLGATVTTPKSMVECKYSDSTRPCKYFCVSSLRGYW
jgi:predicted phage-related endonuclease